MVFHEHDVFDACGNHAEVRGKGGKWIAEHVFGTKKEKLS